MSAAGRVPDPHGPRSWTTDAILRRAAGYGFDRVAVVVAEDGRTVSYGALDEAADRMARALADLGVRPGDRVAVLMGNAPEYLVAYHGVARCGAIFVPVVTQSKLPEIEYVIEHSEACVLMADKERWEVVAPAMRARHPAFSTVRHVVLAGGAEQPGTLPLDQVLASARGPGVDHVPREDDPVAFMYTSGSTGRPKAVVHSHYTAVAQAEAVSSRMGYTRADRLMTVFPLFHGNALVWSALAAVWAGARVIIHRRFSASRFWDAARTHGATEVNLLIGATNMVLAQPERPDDRDNPVRVVLANVTQSAYERFTTRFDVDIVSTWALAEGPLGTMTAPGYGYSAGLIGWPMGTENEVRVVDADESEVPVGAVGELVQRNRAAMTGYYKNPAETARVLRNGWVHSGDLGYRDQHGLFYFVGREKHVIRRSGENVSGEEVEECLNAHPAIGEAAVIAVPDDVRGEEVKACIVTREGAELTPEAVVEWCAERLSDFKLPRYVEFLDSLPRTGPLRVDRPALARRPGVTDCWDRLSHVH